MKDPIVSDREELFFDEKVFLKTPGYYRYESELNVDFLTVEANRFASYLLMPFFPQARLSQRTRTPEVHANTFNVPIEIAKFRLRDYRES